MNEDLIVPDTVCAILAAQGDDNFYLVRINKTFEYAHEVTDKFEHEIPAGVSAVEVQYLEKHSDNPMKGTHYNISKDTVYIYKETIVYPAVPVAKKRTRYFLTNITKTEINYYIESRGLLSEKMKGDLNFKTNYNNINIID